MRTLAIVLFSMLCSVLPAAADDAQMLTACLETESKAGRDGRACIGRISDPCLKGSNAETTTGMVECLDGETAVWDKILNADYENLLKVVPEGATKSVRAAQRAWIALRDADCAVPYDIFEGGTIARIDGASCVQNHTATRVLQLRIWRLMAQPEE
jgi:uncharacterized protein YecT (DUF1311 family)